MRRPKPFYRKQTESWYVQLGNEWHRLSDRDPKGDTKEAAWAAYDQLMVDRRSNGGDVPKRSKYVGPTVGEVFSDFIAWCETNRAKRTAEYYQIHLKRFQDFIGDSIQASAVGPIDVEKWLDSRREKESNTTRHGAIQTIERAFNWAVKRKLIKENPIKGMDRPRRTNRTTVLTEDQYKAILAASRDQQFRDLLTVAWETGCRPQEVCTVEARHVDGDRWIFEKTESKGGVYNRVVFLTPNAIAITQRLAKENPTGRLFRNRYGRPWNKSVLKCRFQRLRKKLGIPKVSLYTFRHSYATHAIKKRRVDLLTLATLMGHRDTTMVMRVYGHLQEYDHLAEAARKAIGA